MIDKELVIRKINLIQEDLEQLQKYKRTAREDIEKDIALEAAIERYLERMITRAIELNQHLIAESEMRDIKIPKDYKGTFMALGDLKNLSERIREKHIRFGRIPKYLGSRV